MDKSSEDCFYLGLMYYNGYGVKKDYLKSVKLFKKACDLGCGEGCNNLGIMYKNGKGVKQNFVIAKKYFARACYMKIQEGCMNIKSISLLRALKKGI